MRPTGHDPAEHGPQEERELDVSHAHPGRVDDGRHEEEPGGAEGGQRPLRARMEQRLGGEHDRRRPG